MAGQATREQMLAEADKQFQKQAKQNRAQAARISLFVAYLEETGDLTQFNNWCRQNNVPTPDDDGLVEALCEVQHDAYERAADEFGWATNPESRKPWADVPESNKETMRASMRAVLKALQIRGKFDD